MSHALLDTMITPVPDGTLPQESTENPHTEQYIQWDSHHHIAAAKYSVIGTLIHRDKTVCSI